MGYGLAISVEILGWGSWKSDSSVIHAQSFARLGITDGIRSVMPEWYQGRVPLDPSLVSEIKRQLAAVKKRDQTKFAKAPFHHPQKFERAIDQFEQAVELAVAGELIEAREIVSAINDKPIVDWFDRIAQNVGRIRVEFVGMNPKGPERLYKDKRVMNAGRAYTLAKRGGWRCGYCGTRVIEPRVLRRAQKLLGKSVFPSRTTGGSNRDYHGVWLLAALTIDHIKPLCSSGDDSDANLVAACWACNFGKYHFTLDQLGLDRPRQKSSVRGGWRGLTQWL